MRLVDRRFLVTGATGFVGQRLVQQLASAGYRVIGTSTRDVFGTTRVAAGWIPDSWAYALSSVNTVVHLGARVHKRDADSVSARSAFRRANCDTTGALAVEASRSGVERFIYLSTAGVYGSCSEEVIDELARVQPTNMYSESKLAGEGALRSVVDGTNMAATILRCPLVYGIDAPGSLAQLRTLVGRGVPLPFGSVRNRRSAVYRENLVDLLLAIACCPDAVPGTYNVSDGTTWSTPELIQLAGASAGRRARLLALPVPVVRSALRAAGRSGLEHQLLRSLVVDGSRLHDITGWVPPTPPVEALALGVC